jgi:hypothetical protein
MAYAAGNPIMSDAEFDELKLRLKVSSPLLPASILRMQLRVHQGYALPTRK